MKRLLAGQLGKVLTTDPKDREDWRAGRPRYERLFERHVETIVWGRPGHASALFDPPQYVHGLQQALA